MAICEISVKKYIEYLSLSSKGVNNIFKMAMYVALLTFNNG